MKTKPIRYLDVTRKEYEAEIDYLISEGMSERARRFQAEIEKAEKDIQKKPDGYGFIQGYRSYGPTKKEKYRVNYIETTDEIIIIAVYFTGLGDPYYWIGR